MARLTTVTSYYNRSMDLLQEDVAADIFNPDHPIRTKDRSDPSTYYSPDSKCVHSLVADGCIIEGTVEDCVIFRGVHVGKNAVIKNCVLMQDTVIEDRRADPPCHCGQGRDHQGTPHTDRSCQLSAGH